jgi:hypothetical protein
MISERCIWKDVEGSGCSLIWGIIYLEGPGKPKKLSYKSQPLGRDIILGPLKYTTVLPTQPQHSVIGVWHMEFWIKINY